MRTSTFEYRYLSTVAMRRACWLTVCTGCLALPFTALAAPLTTAFTYQGRLEQNGALANGAYDLKFGLYADPTGGALVVPAIEIPNQGVNGGLVSADLNFGGTAIFDGRAFYLEISARQQGSATYVLLPGRTAIRPTPYSIHALSAATVKDGGVTANSLAAGAVTTAKLATGAVGLAQLNVVIPPASGQVLTYNGAGLSWLSPSAGPWLLSGANAFYNAGNVGIGTNMPAEKLTVFATGYGFEQTDGTVRLATYTAASHNAGFIGTRSNHKLHLEVNGSPRLTVGTDGNVGIGTSTPTRKLTVVTSGSSYGFEHTDGTASLTTFVGSGTCYFGTQSNHRLNLETNGSSRLSIGTDGNVGIGTISPAQKLDVSGNIKATVLILRPDPFAPTNAAVICEDAGVTQFVPYNTATNKPLNIVVTDASVRALTIRGGADLAEPFAMSHEGVEPGTVVVIDAAHPGKLKASTCAYDKKVAGIVSGANGIRPGISMIQEDKLEAGENVALSGRVYVKADTSAGSIEPGDLLTTSATAGRAMKAADHSQAQGAIIGKAMTPLADGDGMVLVLVSLQ